jgi:hypothetical protein
MTSIKISLAKSSSISALSSSTSVFIQAKRVLTYYNRQPHMQSLISTFTTTRGLMKWKKDQWNCTISWMTSYTTHSRTTSTSSTTKVATIFHSWLRSWRNINTRSPTTFIKTMRTLLSFLWTIGWDLTLTKMDMYLWRTSRRQSMSFMNSWLTMTTSTKQQKSRAISITKQLSLWKRKLTKMTSIELSRKKVTYPSYLSTIDQWSIFWLYIF